MCVLQTLTLHPLDPNAMGSPSSTKNGALQTGIGPTSTGTRTRTGEM